MPLPSVTIAEQLPLITGRASTEKGGAKIEVHVPWRVHFDGVGSTFFQALEAVPPFGDTIGQLVLLAKEPRMNPEDECEWEVDCIYSIPEPGQEAAPPADELDEEVGSRWAVEVTINSVSIEQEVQADIFGNMIQNAAGDPISGVMVERNEEEIVWSFTTNLVIWGDIDTAFGTLGRGCINSEAFEIQFNGAPRTFAEGTLRFMSYSYSLTLDPSGEIYTRMSFRTRWRPEGWLRQLANKGLNILVDDDKYPIFDTHGNVVTPPQYLTADGTRIVIEVDPEGEVNFVKCPRSNTDPGVSVYQQADLGTILFRDLNT